MRACVTDNYPFASTLENSTASASTIETNLLTDADNQLPASPDCSGRTVVVGEECIDLIYILDCSKNVGEENFHNSLDFVGRSAGLFNINNDTPRNDTARVALITFDDKVHPIFNLGEKATLVKTINAINKTKLCGGATALGRVLKFVREKVIPISRPQCKRAIFLISDGLSNCGGDPIVEAEELKKEKGLEIYTIAFAGRQQGKRVDSKTLKALASNANYHFKVRNASTLRDEFKKGFTTRVGKNLCDTYTIGITIFLGGLF